MRGEKLVGRIFFNVDEAREFLLKTGFVYTLRKPRTVGRTVAVKGGYFNFIKLCDVRVSLVKRDVTMADLYLYVNRSGFNTVADWLTVCANFLKCNVNPEMLVFFNLYHVVRVYNHAHCPLIPSSSIRKDGTCKRSTLCSTGARDLTAHPLCQLVSHKASNLRRMTGEKKMKKKKVKKAKTTPATGKEVKKAQQAKEAKEAKEAKRVPKVTAEQVLAVMKKDEKYSSTALVKALGLTLYERAAVNKICEKLAAENKIVKEVIPQKTRKKYRYTLA